ncbi:hypothetical protein DCAR_0625480 [Daucus carota subsp. sativus]|uniref:Uncharacterized protein n=1 Tax=Daucus carota subsp. sativus TaxID=79200 RepID=A0A161XFT1_DAUCS|nr:PREDICTED: probable membrane-associated kinase regulator 4 [Daucus carota subsp. sativus]WOH06057.1 hypothetical protein DCAR_0625480 [Daucus carota subsp. sativus]
MASYCKHVEGDDEGYMAMDSSSFSKFTHYSSPQGREFEFIADDQAREFIIFPADELFYEGKILPLHLSPRLQMLQSLLQNSAPTPVAQECNVSPPESLCITSDKLNDYFLTQLSEENFIVGDSPKKSWPKKKLKLIRKLLAYRAHLKSFLAESSCTSEAFTIASPKKREDENVSTGGNDSLSRKVKTSKKMSSTKSLISDQKVESESPKNVSPRRPFCRKPKPVKCLSSSSSSSSLFSSSSSSSYGQNLQKMRDSFGSDTEGSVDAAIAHCKKSQENIDDTESGYWSFSVKNCRLH